MSERRRCKRCGLEVLATSSGHLRAHACPHARICQPSYAMRREGVRPSRCADCAAELEREQIPLFGEGT
jgi:hypothetical protein